MIIFPMFFLTMFSLVMVDFRLYLLLLSPLLDRQSRYPSTPNVPLCPVCAGVRLLSLVSGYSLPSQLPASVRH